MAVCLDFTKEAEKEVNEHWLGGGVYREHPVYASEDSIRKIMISYQSV